MIVANSPAGVVHVSGKRHRMIALQLGDPPGQVLEGFGISGGDGDGSKCGIRTRRVEGYQRLCQGMHGFIELSAPFPAFPQEPGIRFTARDQLTEHYPDFFEGRCLFLFCQHTRGGNAVTKPGFAPEHLPHLFDSGFTHAAQALDLGCDITPAAQALLQTGDEIFECRVITHSTECTCCSFTLMT